MFVGELFPNEILPTESIESQTFSGAQQLLGLSGNLLSHSPWEHSFSGGGQGCGPQPPCKRKGTQDRARREKITNPQKPKPPKPKKNGG